MNYKKLILPIGTALYPTYFRIGPVFREVIDDRLPMDVPFGLESRALTFGQSITDACLGWDDSVKLLDRLAEAVRVRRRK